MAKVTPPGRRGIRKGPSIPASLPPEHRAFFEQIYAQTNRHVYHVDGWFDNNVAANLAALKLVRNSNAAAAVDFYVAPRDGWVWTIWVLSTAARTAGTLTVNVFKNGAQLGTIGATLDGVNTTYKAIQTPTSENMPFLAGDKLDLRVTTTAAWAPTSADIIAGIEVEV